MRRASTRIVRLAPACAGLVVALLRSVARGRDRGGGSAFSEPEKLGVDFELFAGHGTLDAYFQRRQPAVHDVDRAQQERDQLSVGVLLAFAEPMEKLLDLDD